MAVEIDFFPVGDESSPGDAIIVRYGNLDGPRDQQTVIVIDGGYTATGKAIVDHLATDHGIARVDIVVSTHPDRDHITGLHTVIEQLDVDLLLMHDPDQMAQSIWKGSAFDFTSASLSYTFAKSLRQSRTLRALAAEHGVTVAQPFAGMSITPEFHILGPTQDFYSTLARQMIKEPARGTELARKEAFAKSAKPPIGTDRENLHTELLSTSSATTASNNTSVVSLLRTDGITAMFTGDAGEEALRPVLDELAGHGIVAGELGLVQVPHHGSRKNVTPALLDDLLGPTTGERRGFAVVSVPTRNDEYQFPAKQTTNAFCRRGYPVIATAGHMRMLTSNPDAPEPDESGVLPLFDRVEIFDD